MPLEMVRSGVVPEIIEAVICSQDLRELYSSPIRIKMQKINGQKKRQNENGRLTVSNTFLRLPRDGSAMADG